MTPARALARLHVPLLAAAAAALALGAAQGDSPTIDEPGHLAAGLAAWHEADYRLSPDHPPLARRWAAAPVYLRPHAWPAPGAPGWSDGNFFRVGRELFARNDPQRLLLPARAAMVVLMCATLVAVWWTAHALWGSAPAAALALATAALDPGLLAHGHYVTTDLPLALTALLSVVACARVLQVVTPLRLAAAAAALCAALLSKLSALLLLPALAGMALFAVLRPGAMRLRLPGRPERTLGSRARRGTAVLAIGAGLALALWAGLWAGYGFRYGALAGADAAHAVMYPAAIFGPPAPANMDETWELLLRDGSSGPRQDFMAVTVRAARRHRLLPEGYLYGLAALGRHAAQRVSYLRGDIAVGGRASYFPLAFAWKTPLPTLLLAALGLAALVSGRARPGDAVLLAGLVLFVACYAYASLRSDLNVGHRHLLPLYPAVFVAAGAAWSWATTRVARVAIGALCAWLAASTLAAYPHFLGYFNELAGGGRNGFRLLADSNVDWSQDLVRLRDYVRAHPGEAVALQQSGRAPWPRGLDVLPLLPREPGERAAPWAPGVYVVSANELLGLFKPYQRAASWRDPRLLAGYRALWAGERFASSAAEQDFDAMRRALLVSRLAARAPDDRIGTSLFVYRLSDADLDALTRP